MFSGIGLTAKVYIVIWIIRGIRRRSRPGPYRDNVALQDRLKSRIGGRQTTELHTEEQHPAEPGTAFPVRSHSGKTRSDSFV